MVPTRDVFHLLFCHFPSNVVSLSTPLASHPNPPKYNTNRNRLFATKRGVDLFASRFWNFFASFLEVSFIIVMVAVQTCLFVVMLSSSDNFDSYQAPDAYFIFSIEMVLILFIVGSILAIKFLEKHEKRHPWAFSLIVFAKRFDRVSPFPPPPSEGLFLLLVILNSLLHTIHRWTR